MSVELSRFETAADTELAPFLAQYGLKKRFVENHPLRTYERVVYDNGKLAVCLSVDYADGFLDGYICRTDELDDLICPRRGGKRFETYCRLWRSVYDRHPEFQIPSIARQAMKRTGGLESILAKANEALILLGPEFFGQFL
jgi:hypothetical protein